MEITLSMKEQEKLAIIIQYADGKISCSDAAKQLGLSVRQVQRKKKAYLVEGMSSIIHKAKGKASGRGYSEAFKQHILTIYRQEYAGWNFCHFSDVLEDEYFYLHGAIDDATSIVVACILMEQETCLDYQLLMRDTIQHYGIPECLYTDYRTVFQSNQANKEMSLEDYVAGKK